MVVVSSTAVVIAMRAVDMDIEVVRVLELAVDVMRMETVERIILGLLDGSWIKLLVVMVGSMLVVTDSKVRAHPKHVEDICGVHVCLLRNGLLLVREHALPIFSEILASKVVGYVLITMGGMGLVRGKKIVLIAWIKSALQGVVCGFAGFADMMVTHRCRWEDIRCVQRQGRCESEN